MEAETFSISFLLTVENSLRHVEHHLDFSDPHVEETLVPYEGDVLSYTSEHLSCHSCHASLLQALHTIS
jgi:hypothetical protein